MSSRRAQIVVLKDANNNKRRMYIDYSQTVNLFTELDACTLLRIETLIKDLAKYHGVFNIRPTQCLPSNPNN